jgi:hypothetical protein
MKTQLRIYQRIIECLPKSCASRKNKGIIQGFEWRQMDVGFVVKRREFVVSMDINRGSTFETTQHPLRSFLLPPDSPLKIESE